MGQVYNNDIHMLKKTKKNPPMTYLEEGTATHSSILAGESPGQRSLMGSIGSQRVRHD